MMILPQLPLYVIAIICGLLSFLVTHLSFGPCQNTSDGELMIVLLIIFLTDVSLFKNMLRPILNIRANIF